MKLNQFEVIKTIGQGSYGDVMLAKSKLNLNEIKQNEIVAMKIISKKKSKSIMIEIEVLRKVQNHPFCSQVIGCFQDRTDVFIILKFEENASLDVLLERHPKLTLDFAQSIMVDIVLALKFLHEFSIVHGDLKPGNILLDINYRAKLSDFGLSRNFQTEQLRGIWGTATYQSPEQLSQDEAWGSKVDIFIVGIILLEMISGSHPFEKDTRNDNEVHFNIMNLNYEIPTDIDDEYPSISFILRTLCQQEIRLDAKSAAKHPFIANQTQKALNTYKPAPATIYKHTRTEKYHNDRNFFPILSHIEFTGCDWGKTIVPDQNAVPSTNIVLVLENKENIPESGTAIVRNKEETPLKATNLLIEKLKGVQGTEQCGIIKQKNNEYYVKCKCDKKYKAIGQIRGKKNRCKWTIQPFKRHFKKIHL